MNERKHIYTATFEYHEHNKTYSQIGELKVELPTPPKVKHMRNYGLPKAEQKFTYEEIPEDYHKWEEGSKELDDYCQLLYHIRDNGEWWLINGKQVYICGGAWFFFNFWTLQQTDKPIFRMEAVEFFQVEDWAYRNPFCLGLAIIKRRQEGATAKINCAMYFRITRLKGAKGGIIGDDEDRGKSNIEKIWTSHNEMFELFKPKHKGSNKSPNAIPFTLPEATQSLKKLSDKKDKTEHKGLESSIMQKAPSKKTFDGDRLHYFYFDEYGKVWRFDPNEKLSNIRPSMLSIKGDGSFSGKCIFGSTVEESDANPAQIEKIMKSMTKIWRDSNPNQLDSKGRTKSGLIRYFRDAISSADLIDEFGFVRKDEVIKDWEEKVAAFEREDDFSGLSAFKRLYPRSIDDALSPSSEYCVLFPHLLNRKIVSIQLGEDIHGEPCPPKAVRGNLHWVDKIGGDVRWIANEKGKWLISQHPIEPNAKRVRGNRSAPKNSDKYAMGLDPTDAADASSIDSELSKTAIVVKRKFDRGSESDEIIYETIEGVERILNPDKLKTNRVVCTYHHRNNNPYDNVDDALKTAVYYGCGVLVEKNLAYVYNRIKEDFPNYLAVRPNDGTKTMAAAVKIRRQNPETGIRTSAQNKPTYNDITISYFHDYWMIIEHLDLLLDAKNFNGQNHTKCDLIVAFALAQLQDEAVRQKAATEVEENGWNHNPTIGYKDY